MRLSAMREGQRATIVRVGGSGRLAAAHPGDGDCSKAPRFRSRKYAPLKDPIEIVVKGAHISLRVEEAAQISVLDVR